MSEQYAELITGFPLFQGFTVNGTKRLLDSGEVKEHSAGAVLLKEGDNASFVLLVLAGRLEVFVERDGKDLVLTETKPGTVVGELAVLCGIPRSAVRAGREDPALARLPARGHGLEHLHPAHRPCLGPAGA